MGSRAGRRMDSLMTDKEILEEVYRRLVWSNDNWQHMNMDRLFDKVHDMKDTIEQEWQRADLEDNNTPKLETYKQQLKDMIVMDDYDGGKAAMLREVIEDMEKEVYEQRG